MGKGQGQQSQQPQQVTSTNTTSNLPEYARPYFESLMNRATEVSNDPYQAYTGNRVAGFNPDQDQAFQQVRNAQGWAYPSFDKANQAYGQGIGSIGRAEDAFWQALNIGIGTEYDPERVTNTYVATEYNPNSWTDPGVSGRYMSPYMQNVIDIDAREADRKFQIQNVRNEAAAAAGGAYGGYRHGIVDAEAQRNQAQLQDDIQFKGQQAAYESGLGAFDRDRTAFLGANQLNNDFRQQESKLGMSATNANNQWGLEAAKLKQAGGKLALDAGTGYLGAANSYGGLGGAYAGLGESTQRAAYRDADALLNIGNIQQANTQQGYDVAYNDFLNQRDYPRQNLNWLNSILRGVPISASSNVTSSTTGAAPSYSSQIAGLGLGGIGLSKLFG